MHRCKGCGKHREANNGFVCNDGTRLWICKVCQDALILMELRMKQERKTGQQWFIPPDALAPLSLIALHGGVSFEFSELPF